ncbi:hypothetical protein [Amycolatopsis sp. CA-126428]|uniref:hypothetical protein n=1 Tax=Amycolatopsis sp. CA-126428 TaxID=2073158 RepID=UPI0011B00F67|nr:hypothetical protein [Amycolatopsis sp. CA-126428]
MEHLTNPNFSRDRRNRITAIAIDIYPSGLSNESATHDRKCLIVMPPNQSSNIRVADRLREAGLETFGFGQSIPENGEYLLTPRIVNGSGNWVPDTIEFALTSLSSGVIGNAAYDALKKFVHSFASTKNSEVVRPLTDPEAEFWGVAMISRRYRIDANDLSIEAVTLSPPNAQIRATGPDGSIYTAEIEIIDGLAALGTSTREAPRQQRR